MKMLRSSLTVTRMDRIRRDQIRNEAEMLDRGCWRRSCRGGGGGDKGRPQRRFMDVVTAGMETVGVKGGRSWCEMEADNSVALESPTEIYTSTVCMGANVYL